MLFVATAILFSTMEWECSKDPPLGPYEHPHSMLQNKTATAKLGFEIYALTTIPEQTDVGGWVRGRARPRPNPFGEGKATGQLLMGSRVITVSM